MLQQGWKIADEFKLQGNNSLGDSYSSPNEEREIPFKANHLKDMGYDVSYSGERTRLKNILLIPAEFRMELYLIQTFL